MHSSYANVYLFLSQYTITSMRVLVSQQRLHYTGWQTRKQTVADTRTVQAIHPGKPDHLYDLYNYKKLDVTHGRGKKYQTLMRINTLFRNQQYEVRGRTKNTSQMFSWQQFHPTKVLNERCWPKKSQQAVKLKRGWQYYTFPTINKSDEKPKASYGLTSVVCVAK